MSDVKLGQLTDSKAVRDAIHVAVLPAMADRTLGRGQRVNIVGIYAYPVTGEEKGDGVVDPWLERDVYNGEIFWVLMHPGTVNNLRHAWSHPHIEDDEEMTRVFDSEYECKGC